MYDQPEIMCANRFDGYGGSIHEKTGANPEELGWETQKADICILARRTFPLCPTSRGELDSRHTGPRIIAPASGRHLIGWQPGRDRKDGAAFVVLRFTVFDSRKVIEAFPLTEDGWCQAWQALVRIDAVAAEKARATLTEQADLAALKAATIGCVPEVIYLGGHAPGSGLAARKSYDLRFLTDSVAVLPCRRAGSLVQVPYRDVEVVDIGGPGLVKSGGGFAGGGFGVAGAVEGMTIAGVLNALTTKTKIRTVVRIQAAQCELFLLSTTTEPETLRIELSQALGAIRQARAGITASTDDSPGPGAPNGGSGQPFGVVIG